MSAYRKLLHLSVLMIISLASAANHWDSTKLHEIRDELFDKSYSYKAKRKALNKFEFSIYPEFTNKNLRRMLQPRIMEIFMQDSNTSQAVWRKKPREVYNEYNYMEYRPYRGRRIFSFSNAYRDIVALSVGSDHQSYHADEIYYFNLKTGREYFIDDLYKKEALREFEQVLRAKALSLMSRDLRNLRLSKPYHYLVRDKDEEGEYEDDEEDQKFYYPDTGNENDYEGYRNLHRGSFIVFNKFSVSVVIPYFFDKSYGELVLRFSFEEINPYLNPEGPYFMLELPRTETKLKGANQPRLRHFDDPFLLLDLCELGEIPEKVPEDIKRLLISKKYPADTGNRIQTDTLVYRNGQIMSMSHYLYYSTKRNTLTYRYDSNELLLAIIDSDPGQFNSKFYAYDRNKNLILDSVYDGRMANEGEICYYYYKKRTYLKERYDLFGFGFRYSEIQDEKNLHWKITRQGKEHTKTCLECRSFGDSLVYYYNSKNALIKIEEFIPDTVDAPKRKILGNSIDIENNKLNYPVYVRSRYYYIPEFYIRYE